MRLPILDPKDLTDEQKPLYDDMRAGIKDHFKGFVNMRDDGALLGPWNPWIREPRFGKPVWELVKAIASNPLLPAPVREVAILVTGSHFRSGYELYAHVLVAEQRGLSDEKLATIVAGQRPVDLTKQEAVAYDVASALVSGGVLPELTWRAAVKEFGEHGAAELSYLVGSIAWSRSRSTPSTCRCRSSRRLVLFEHDLFGKPLHTFPDHAQFRTA